MHLHILGAESLGREAALTARLLGGYDRISFLDDRPELAGRTVAGFEVQGGFGAAAGLGGDHDCFFVAVGRPDTRLRLMADLQAKGLRLARLVHPSAVVCPTATIGENCLVNALCHIGPHVALGAGSILWSSVTVSHDAVVGRGCFFSPNVAIGGYADIGEESMIGLGAMIRSDVVIGSKCVVAMGVAVTEDLPEHHFASARGYEPIRGRPHHELFFHRHSERAMRRASRLTGGDAGGSGV